MANEPKLKGLQIITTQEYPLQPKLKGIQIVTTQANPLQTKLKAIHIVTAPIATTLLAGTYKQLVINS